MMNGFKRIMIGLDFSQIDQSLIQYAAFLSQYLRPEKIYFVNIQPDLDVPDSLREAFPELNQPRDEKLCDDMRNRVYQWFPEHTKYDIDCQVIEGSPRRELARWAHIKNVDLLIVGRKDQQNGKGIVPQQLARKLECSILFVPEHPRYRLQDVLVANDFSENARSALKAASALAGANEEIHLYSGHVYSLPQGYYRTGKSEEEFSEIMHTHARQRYQHFLSEMDEKVSVEPIFYYDREHRSTARVLDEMAHEKQMDLIIVGSRGHTSASAFLLGSVSEKLIRINDSTPVLMVKHPAHIKLLEVVDAL